MKVEKFEKRPHDDGNEAPLWSNRSVGKELVTWPKFKRFWHEHYPQIKVRARGADTCSNCLKLLYSLSKQPPSPLPVDNNNNVEILVVEQQLQEQSRRLKVAENLMQKH